MLINWSCFAEVSVTSNTVHVFRYLKSRIDDMETSEKPLVISGNLSSFQQKAQPCICTVRSYASPQVCAFYWQKWHSLSLSLCYASCTPENVWFRINLFLKWVRNFFNIQKIQQNSVFYCSYVTHYCLLIVVYFCRSGTLQKSWDCTRLLMF